MYSILVAIVFLSLLSVLVLLWLRTGRRKKQISNLERSLDRLKRSKGSPVQKTELSKLKNELGEVLRELENRVGSLRKQVDRLERRITELETSKKHGRGESRSGKDPSADSTGPRELDSGHVSGHEREDRRDYQSQRTGKRSAQRQIEVDYNQILNGDLGRREFQSKYEPVALGIKNERERLDREEAPVLLEEDERGQYLSIETDSGHLIVPQPEITLEDPTRRQAGYDEVFQCGQSPHNHPYVVQRLREVAQFVKRTDGTYSLSDPGCIDLERYD